MSLALLSFAFSVFASAQVPAVSGLAVSMPGGGEGRCTDLVFGPESPVSAQAAWLTWTECPPQSGEGYGPGRGNIGRTPGEGPCLGGVDGRKTSRMVRVELRDRPALKAWETDKVWVCLQNGGGFSADPYVGPCKYKRVSENRGSAAFSCVKRRAVKPDSAGIVIVSVSKDLAVALKDKWAADYAGEKIELDAVVMRDVPGWFDAKVGEVDMTVPVSDGYTLFLQDSVKGLEYGQRYYVKVSFKRLGSVSTAERVDAGKSAKVDYKP